MCSLTKKPIGMKLSKRDIHPASDGKPGMKFQFLSLHDTVKDYGPLFIEDVVLDEESIKRSKTKPCGQSRLPDFEAQRREYQREEELPYLLRTAGPTW